MKWLSLFVLCLSCASPGSPAASLTPTPVPSSAPAFPLCAPPESNNLSELKGWGALSIGMTVDDFQATLTQHNIKPQREENHGYAQDRNGAPSVHFTLVDITFSCDSISGRAFLDGSLKKIEGLNISFDNINEQEARLLMNRLEANYGKPSRSHSLDVENVFRDDRCWTNNTVELCAVLIQTKDQYRSTWKLQRQYRAVSSQ